MLLRPSQIIIFALGLFSANPLIAGTKVQDFLNLPDADVEAMKITKRQLNSVLRLSSKSAVVDRVRVIDHNGPDLFSSVDVEDSGVVSVKVTKCVLAQMAELKGFDAKKEFSQHPSLRYHVSISQTDLSSDEEVHDPKVAVTDNDASLTIWVQSDGRCSFVPASSIRHKLTEMYAEQDRRKSVEERVPANENLLMDAVHETSFHPSEGEPAAAPFHGEI